mmetsp:Transcript_94651/g.164216  ORF Transcript_94651/g.164216 Transcript_94651/m.164216 type:complete len:190 (+) Transcript_94651:86-655(+)
MAHCTDSRVWKEYVDRERYYELAREASDVPEEPADHTQVNPYSGDKPFFTRGLAHMFYNDSSRTRMVLGNTDDPLRSRRHVRHMMAPREGPLTGTQSQQQRLPSLNLQNVQTSDIAPSSDSRRERSITWRLDTPSEIPELEYISTPQAVARREDKTRGGPLRRYHSARRSKENGRFSRSMNYGKMLLPI